MTESKKVEWKTWPQVMTAGRPAQGTHDDFTTALTPERPPSGPPLPAAPERPTKLIWRAHCVPDSWEEETIGSREPFVPKRLSFKDEEGTVREELSSVHKAYKETLRGKDQLIASLRKDIAALSSVFVDEISSIQDDLEVTEGELEILQKSEKEWIGRTLKMKFLFDQLNRLEAIPKDHRESWLDDAIEAITIPEVSIAIRDEFIPTAQTDNIDWTDEEEDAEALEDEDDEYFLRFGDELARESGDEYSALWSQCDTCGVICISGICGCSSPPPTALSWQCGGLSGEPEIETPPQLVEECDDPSRSDVINLEKYPRAILEKSAKTIQTVWRGYRIRLIVSIINQLGNKALIRVNDYQREVLGNNIDWLTCNHRPLLILFGVMIRKGAALTIQRHWRSFAPC